MRIFWIQSNFKTSIFVYHCIRYRPSIWWAVSHEVLLTS